MSRTTPLLGHFPNSTWGVLPLRMRLRRSRILRSWGDFQRVRKEGKSHASKHLVMGVLNSAENCLPTFGFITSKRVGNAVTRNKVRRRLRAVVTDLGDEIPRGHRVVTIARVHAATASYETLRSEWQQLARRAGLLQGGERSR